MVCGVFGNVYAKYQQVVADGGRVWGLGLLPCMMADIRTPDPGGIVRGS